MILLVGMAPGPDFFANIARQQNDEQNRLKHYWRVQKAFTAMREWGKAVQQRLRRLEARAGTTEKRLTDLERRLGKGPP